MGSPLEVGQAVRAAHDLLSVLRDGDRAPGRVRRGPGEDLVDLGGLVLRVRGRAGEQGGDSGESCQDHQAAGVRAFARSKVHGAGFHGGKDGRGHRRVLTGRERWVRFR